jgi:DNA mismatch repair protein MutL
MGKIALLSELVANQIAAGEVVERPASVVKELIENALDAGATQIDVHIEAGGSKRIVIQDNGEGMDAADAVLAFSRHATSKLRTADDLRSLGSFGFRGEALPSIASVSRLRLTTRLKGAALATDVAIHGGALQHVREAGAVPGTRVEVADLFFNVPARLKFLRSERAELLAIEQGMRAVAMANPRIGFSLRVEGGRCLFEVGADAPELERVIQALSEEVRGALYAFKSVDFNKPGSVNVRGYAGAPTVTRRDSRGIHVFVNGRPVIDQRLSQLVKLSYKTLLEIGRYPWCVLFIDVDPGAVDVNVHPQKSQVRFADVALVESAVMRTLRDFLATTPWAAVGPRRAYVLERSLPESAFFEQPIVRQVGATPELVSADEPWSRPQTFAPLSLSLSPSLSPAVLPAPSPTLPLAEGLYSRLRIIGQVAQTYLLFEGDMGLVLVDQHAAHERVLFEKLCAEFEADGLKSQRLLFPITLKLSFAELSALDQHQDNGPLLKRLGLELERFGEHEALVRALPPGLNGENAENLCRSALAALEGAPVASEALAELRDRFCALIACHSSVRKGQLLSHEEIRALVAQMDAIDFSAHCPHGRPVAKIFREAEMAKWFSRP